MLEVQTQNSANKLDSERLWKAVLAELQLSLSELNYNTWFKNTLARNLTENSLEIVVSSSYAKKRMQTQFYSLIESSVNKIGKGKYKLSFAIEDIEKIKKKNGIQKETEIGPLFKTAEKTIKEINLKDTGLHPKFTFENYLMGKTNQLAYAIATTVAEKPGEAYNPYFLYSGVGLGKTHLMQAIGHRILQKNPNVKVLYCTGESYTNEFIEALQGKKGGKYAGNTFRNKYRNVDVLLIDDVQFIAGKEATQEEFFHTFNTLLMSQKQIVLTSDRPPKDFTNLEARIKSRFGSGIIADIQAPDVEMRTAILRAKRDRNNEEIPNEALDYIAERVSTNVRELEGAYLQVLTFAKATGKKVTKELAAEALGQSIIEQTSKPINLNQILKLVSNYYSITIKELKGKKRSKDIVIPRHIAMYLMYDLTKTPLTSIGELLGGRDHTTVMHGVKKIEEELLIEPQTKEDIANIKQMLHIGSTL